MTVVDQFESVFRSAVRDLFVFEDIHFKSILLVTDIKNDALQKLLKEVQNYLKVLGSSIHWTLIGPDDFRTTEELLKQVSDSQADLIITYRNLQSRAWRYPHSLGEHLDVLLGKSKPPILIIPHPQAGYARTNAMQTTTNIMAITDHLSADHRLVNYAAAFCTQDGKLILTHIEDRMIFDRYMDAISKIRNINTEDAVEEIRKQLLKGPLDYIESCRKELLQRELHFEIKDIVVFGHRLHEYRTHIETQNIDLLIMNAKQEDKLGMHGMAYTLAVELRSISLLML